MQKFITVSLKKTTVSKLILITVLLIVSLQLANVSPNPSLLAAQQDTFIDFRTYVEDTNLQSVIYEVMNTRPPELLIGVNFAITSARRENDWMLISIASLDGPNCSSQYVGSGNCSGLIIANRDNIAGWQAALAGTQTFSSIISIAPESFVASKAKPYLDPLKINARSATTTIYKFPWFPGDWKYREGWHPHPSGLDVGTHEIDRRILASADGLVVHICRGSLSANVTIRSYGDEKTLGYFHFNMSQLEPDIKEGKEVFRGQLLGSLRPGTWSWDGCGYTVDQGIDSAHLHWVIPTDTAFTVDGWTIEYPDNSWTKEGEDNRDPEDSLTSTNHILMRQHKPFNTWIPWPGGWPYLFQPTDSSVRRLTIGDTFSYNFEGACDSFWYLLEPGNHSLTFWYESRGTGFPTVNMSPFPTVASACAADLPNPPPDSPPLTSDSAAFVSDITLPDGTLVTPGETLVKTWRVRNSGTSTWNGYKLIFQNGNRMGATSPVAIPYTQPGQQVDISIQIQAPDHSSTGYWQIVTPSGTHVQGGRVWVTLDVENTSSPPPPTTNFSIECVNCPTTVAPGQTFRPTVRAIVGSGQLLESRGDMLRHKSGDLFGAWPHVAVVGTVNQGQSYDFTFYADNPIKAPDSNGTYRTTWQLWQNGQWVGPELTIEFKVQSGSGTNHPPNVPNLTGPGDWAVYQGNSGIVLTAQHNGDPDGDGVTHYYFEIFESAQNANSGWITSSSWSPPGLGFNGYQWHVKVRDSRSAESGWSNTWHFTVYDPHIDITQLEFVPLDSAGENVRILACADAPATLKVEVNTANDGSGNGEWRVLKELGVPCFNDIDAPVWNTLEYEGGPHRVRVLARGDGGWENAAVREAVYTIPSNHRPNHPSGILPLNGAHVNSRTVYFDWIDTLRTTSYRLQASTSANFSTLLLDQTFSAGTTEYTHTFASDHATVYWRVIATGPYGTNEASRSFHIDLNPPSSTITALPPVTTDTQFSVNWSGSDTRSGLRWYHVQVRDGDRPDSEWSDWLVNSTKTAELFQGQPGHTYYFRVRAMDQVGNWETWPADNGDTFTLVDPSATPQTAWWNSAYALKRNLIILNNDTDTLPVHYPMHIHFDSTTNPTAAEIYNASLAASKGNDIRVVYNNQTELDRFIQTFTAAQIDIWFPLQAPLGGNQTNGESYQLYYSYAGAGAPPANINDVFLPEADANTMGLWHFQEGNGSTVADSSGRAHHGNFVNAGWTNGYLGRAGNFNGSNAYVEIGHSEDFRPGAITLEAWIYLTDPLHNRNTARIVDKERYGFQIHHDRKVQFILKAAGGDRTLTGSTELSVNQWYHVAATFDGTSQMRVYLNGVLDGQSSAGAPPNNWSTAPLHIGNEAIFDSGYFPGYIQHLRISNVARTGFAYGRIDVPASVAAGSVISPLSNGAPDLVLLSITTYPNPDGTSLVEAVFKNQGDKDTINGFYTDLYLDQLPAGPGISGSIQFWVNSAIEAGATVTLTNVIDFRPLLRSESALNVEAISEVVGTLYAQVDSTGVVSEPDNSNNISTTGTEICFTEPDSFEDDNTKGKATTLAPGAPQVHNIHALADQDWFAVQAKINQTYVIETSNLGPSADTYLYLYGSDGVTQLAANDDYDGTLASRIEWVAPASGTYYLMVKHWNPNVSGCGTSYTISFENKKEYLYLPLVIRDSR